LDDVITSRIDSGCDKWLRYSEILYHNRTLYSTFRYNFHVHNFGV